MSGQAALASARKRRVNLPNQQSASSSNSYQNELNNIAQEFSRNIDSSSDNTQSQRVPLANVVMLHDRKINILKKELDELKLATTEINNDDNSSKVTFSDSETLNNTTSNDLNNLTQKLNTIELSSGDINKSVEIQNTKIKTLEQEFANMKKDVENFKVIFLNVNKIINDLKSLTDSNTNELGLMKNFLNDNQFVTKEESKETENVNKVELEVTEK
jgi:hypothetical protein